MFTRRSLIAPAAVSAIALLATSGTALAQDAAPRKPEPGAKVQQRAKKRVVGAPQIAGRKVPNHYIVLVRRGGSSKAVLRKVGARADHVYRTIRGFSARLSASQVRALRADKRVRRVEQDVYGSIDSVQSTDVNGQPWGLDAIDQRGGLSRTYNYGYTGAGVRVYVIDTGIDASNAQFGGRAQNVLDLTGGNGQDCNGHGTHVAGTIGGATYGVAKQALLRGVRIMGCTGGYSNATLISALDWVRRNAIKPAVVNMSIGSPRSDTVNEATRQLVASGVFVAVAAGNEGSAACTKSPASALGTFTVGSLDSGFTRASSSNYGPCVDAYAPGVGIQSAAIGGGSRIMSGTSMATPHVSGMVALAKQAFGDRDAATWVSWLVQNATTNIVRSNITGTPDRLVWKGTL